MYNTRPGLLIGFHGCDKSDQQILLSNPTEIRFSDKPYEWLGHGLYFWENNYDRAMQWAIDKQGRGKIKEPAVVGAVIDLMHCCDLMDTHFIRMVSTFFKLMELEYLALGKQMPENIDARSDPNKNKLMRFRDCATFEFMHRVIRKQFKDEMSTTTHTRVKLFDSVRGMFPEGGPAFSGAGFEAKNHIQICVRNLNCIKGFFYKREEMNFLLHEMNKVK